MMDPSPNAGSKEVLLATIAAGTANAAGEEFFALLVRNLARAMGVRGAWVTEWLGAERRLRALSFWLGDGYYGDYEYDVAGTPCELVLSERRLCHVPERAIELFPGDRDLAAMSAASYMGVPLEDTGGELLGHVAVLHDAPLPANPELESVLTIFAARASVELQRLRRDRMLESQRKLLARLLDGAMDAIVELDANGRVTQMNHAARQLWGERMMGAPFEQHLAGESVEEIRGLLAKLAAGDSAASAWISRGLSGVDAKGQAFPAEATISRFHELERPYFCVVLRNVLDKVRAEQRIERLESEAEALREALRALQGESRIVGDAPAIRRLLFDLKQVAATDATVLIRGETGTGKELVARAIHRSSRRASKPLVKVNCAAIPASLQESEFFGHEKGAFTGATQRREGRFKIANGGTLFLDEVGELPLELQAKLLRVLQEGEYEPVGSSRTERVDVRLIAATHRDLEAMVREGSFRQDLYYRLNVFPLLVPPLRERGHDVIAIAQALLERMASERGYPVMQLGPDAASRLLAYDWPGNVRELSNVLERALITADGGDQLDLSRALPGAAGPGAEPSASDADVRILTCSELEALERSNLLRALDSTGWKISGPGGAAERLGLRPNTLSSRMKALGIMRPGAERR